MLTCVVDEAAGKAAFVAAEGVELALIMLRDGKMAKTRSLRLLDHAVGGTSGGAVAERVVEARGLKTLFGMFMKKGGDGATVEHLLGVFAGLLMLLPADSEGRIRTLAKFVEREYEKIGRLVVVRRGYAGRLKIVEAEIEEQRGRVDGEMEEEWFSKRLDAGLFALQMTDLCLAWLCAEDDGARGKVKALLEEEGLGLGDVRKTLQGRFFLPGEGCGLTGCRTDRWDDGGGG